MSIDKKCPICKLTKPKSEYHKYFSKVRNRYRISNYCKPCGRAKSKIRAKAYYHENQDVRKEYGKYYRKNNKEKIKKLSAHFTRKYRIELKECYVAEQAAKSLKCNTKDIHDNPELMRAYKQNLLLKRKITGYDPK